MINKLPLLVFALISGFTFTQVGSFDPTFNDGSPYQLQNNISSCKIVSLTNETALNISNYGVPSTPMSTGEEHTQISKITNNVAAFYASAQELINPGFAGQFSGINDYVVMPDNKIIVSGYRKIDDLAYTSIFVGRYNSNGTFDNTFNSGSFYELDYSSSYYNLEVSKVLLLSSGKILCIAKRGGNTNMLIRLNSDGTIDNTYGTNGIYDWNFMGGSYTKINDAIELSSGKILVAGSEYDASNNNSQTGFVARMNADGTIDNSFGSGGLTKVFIGQTDKSYINSIALTSTGEIIAGGVGYWTSAQPWDTPKGGLVKISASGVIDNTFGYYSLISDYSVINKVLVTDSDEIIAGGLISLSSIQSSVFVFMSVTGTVNTAIGPNGLITDSNFPNSEIKDFTIQADGKLIYVQSNYIDNFNNGLIVGRLLMSEGTNSIEENTASQISIVPNPAKSNAVISVEKPTTISVYSMNGVELLNQKIQEEYTLELEGYASGVYFIHTADGQTLKLVKE